ncbi:hypothetical protein L6164_024435 [Bauhinia variegata]|uniref:Uncharacterized protein n=1 Tax=Bauhinia variegata TaxID=167791 RepID=A0ACB9LYY0_BAUVA|nr:hypothetical protein L6164_024435 [Bauhinia variegata]
MPPAFLSIASLYGGFLRRSFISAGLSSQTIRVDDETTVHFWGPENQTTQKPVLVLLHGFGPAAVWQWRHQVEFFSSDFHVYVPDLIFFGGSTSSSAERSETFQASSMGKLVDKLQLKRFHVVGTSYGGFVAYNLAKMLGERVEKVVIASSGVNLTKSDNAALLKRAKLDQMEELLLPSTPDQMRKLMTLCVYKRLHNMMPNFFLNDLINILSSENRKEKLELLEGLTLAKNDVSNISPLQQEVLILWGEHDQIFPLNMASQLQGVIGKKARLELIKEASHLPQIEKPVEVREEASAAFGALSFFIFLSLLNSNPSYSHIFIPFSPFPFGYCLWNSISLHKEQLNLLSSFTYLANPPNLPAHLQLHNSAKEPFTFFRQTQPRQSTYALKRH